MDDKTQLILNFINESSSNMPYVLKDKSVSYTHLDVYKRQSTYTAIASLSNSLSGSLTSFKGKPGLNCTSFL